MLKKIGLVILVLSFVFIGASYANATTTIAVNAITETGALTITSAGALALVAGANNISIGADATAKTIAIGGAAAETINIGATNTTGVITLGNPAQTGVTAISGSTLAGANTLFNASTTSTIAIGGALTTGTLTLGNAAATGIVAINGGTAAANTLFNNVTGGTIAIGVANTGGITIGNGATIKTITIGGGNAVNTIKIGDNATPVNVITIGGTASTLGFYGVTPVVRPSAYTQTYATADKTHAALTSTVITAAVPAAAPAGGVGAAAGGWDTGANRDLAITTINDLRTHAIEMDLDYEALLVDVTDLKQLVNSLIDDQQALGLVQ